MAVILPVSVPWDPRRELPAGQQTAWNGVHVAWSNLMAVLTQTIPACWNQLFHAMSARPQ